MTDPSTTREVPRTDWHTHDLRIGAREYDGATVRAWQVYCVICDEAGRIVLPEAEAATREPSSGAVEALTYDE